MVAWCIPHGGAARPAHLRKGRLRVSQLCALMEPCPWGQSARLPGLPCRQHLLLRPSLRTQEAPDDHAGLVGCTCTSGLLGTPPGPTRVQRSQGDTPFPRNSVQRHWKPRVAQLTRTRPPQRSWERGSLTASNKHNPGNPGVTCPFVSRKLANTQNLRLVCVHQLRTFYLKHIHIPALAKERFLAENIGK